MSALREPASQAIRTRGRVLSLAIAERSGLPALERGDIARETRGALAYLADAVAEEDPAPFVDYVLWMHERHPERQMPLSGWLEDFLCVVEEQLPGKPAALARHCIRRALDRLAHTPEAARASGAAECAELARDYLAALLAADRARASRIVLDAADAGTSVRDIYLHVFQPSLYEVGRLWQTNRVSVAQEHYCTAATQWIMSQLYPKIFGSPKSGRRLVATCVSGELHEIGVRMVADFFEMSGWNTCYLGANTPIESVVSTVEEREAHVLGISATMSFHLAYVSDLVKAVREGSRGDRVKVLLGGHPFNVSADLWRVAGGDGYAANADAAVGRAEALVRGERAEA